MENLTYITRTDAVFLLRELTRLAAERDAALTRLAATRLESANRLAAIRAALAAHHDGERDPLAYLRDQLAEESGSGL
jgi:hypothetical protein